MALIICPECGKSVSDKASACPGCGCPITPDVVIDAWEQTPEKKSDSEILSIPEMWQGYKSKPEMVCPHCNTKGLVIVNRTKAKKGISGAKTTAALATVGLSIWATGLSRKEWVSEAKCKSCDAQWQL